MKGKSKGAGLPKYRGDRLIQETVHDPYKILGKYPEQTLCTECGAVFHQGRWAWGLPSAQAQKEICPACRRIRDKAPAGILGIFGPLLEAHREKILNLVHNEAEAEKKNHPLHRIMQIQEKKGGMEITTTDMHLPRRIGEALRHAFHGKLSLPYGKDQLVFRITWKS